MSLVRFRPWAPFHVLAAAFSAPAARQGQAIALDRVWPELSQPRLLHCANPVSTASQDGWIMTCRPALSRLCERHPRGNDERKCVLPCVSGHAGRQAVPIRGGAPAGDGGEMQSDVPLPNRRPCWRRRMNTVLWPLTIDVPSRLGKDLL